MDDVHDRMPVILRREDWARWTSGGFEDALALCQTWPGPLTADAFMLRLGKRLAVMDVRIFTDDANKPVGQANVTYAIP